MTSDSGGLTDDEMAAVQHLDVLERHRRRPLHHLLDAQALGRTVPVPASYGATELGALPRHRHEPPELGAVFLPLPWETDLVSTEEKRGGAETVRNLKKDGLGLPCNYNGSCAAQQVPMRLLHQLASGGLHDSPVECQWPMDISPEDLLSYLHDAKAASLLEDKTTVSGEVDCGKAIKGCVASFPMLLMVDEKTSIYNSILNVALSTIDASTHDPSERRDAMLFGCRTLPPLLNAAKVGDATKIDSALVSIFVRPVSGKSLVLTVNLDESSQHMMCLYAQKTNTKLELQYFIYGKKRLEPDCTLLSYGVKADSTIHACTGLLGGAPTMSDYLRGKEKDFLIEVTLPNGNVSLEMTKIGCLFLSTWLKCFTRAFVNSKSWNGNFTKDSFKVVHGHVVVNTGAEANVRLDKSSMKADMARLVHYITAIFKKNKSNLTSEFPPYMENLITFLKSRGSPTLYDADRLFIETHVCCVESAARGVLLVMLQKKFKSLSSTRQEEWIRAMKSMEDKSYASADSLSTTAVFQDIITEARKRGEPYGKSKPSVLRLMRDNIMHAPSHRFDKSVRPWREKFQNDDGIELMIPAVNKDFLPEIIYNMIKDKNVDIEAELLEAQVRCTCHICHPSHSGSKGGGESSKQQGSPGSSHPESPGSSQPSTPMAWSKPLIQSLRQGLNLGAPTDVAASHTDKQQSSSSKAEQGWQPARKGKGKRQ